MPNYGFNKDLNSFWKLRPKGTVERTESARIHRFVRDMDETRPYHNSQNYRQNNWPHFTYPVVAYTSPILITELVLDTTAKIEIQNISQTQFNLANWQVIVSSGGSVNINLANATTQTIGILNPGSLSYWTDNALDNYWGSNINWTASGAGWAMIIDNKGRVKDFVGWNWTEADIYGMLVAAGGFPAITVNSTQWVGNGVLPVAGNYGLKRVHSIDTNQKIDWDVSHTAAESSIGVTNPELTIPFRNHEGI